MMDLVVNFRGRDGAQGMLKALPSELRSYILGILEEGAKKAKQELQAHND